MSDIFNLKHIHLKECHSTQKLLKDQWEQGVIEHPIVISTESQSDAIGRRGNKWLTFKNSMAFSFTYPLRTNFTLTPLLIGVLLKQYIEKEFDSNISLKWPNDLLNSKKQKVGGVMIHNFGEILIIGIGINLAPFEAEDSFDYEIGSVLEEQKEINNEVYPHLYSFLLEKYELSDEEIVKLWNDSCVHLNKQITLTDDNKEITGIFNGIGKNGEALIEVEGVQQKFYAGSLKI